MLISLSKFVLLSVLSMDRAFTAAGNNIFRRAPCGSTGNNAIVQLFEWPWDSVASECTTFLGPAGYGYVQVSPASEHITGNQWWTDYQTVSYKLTSKRGSRTQFQNMVSTCRSAGVQVIVDVVFNHMTAGSGTGIAGSTYSKYNYPAVPYTPSNFHYCRGGSSAAEINNYNNAYNVQFCELVGLSDLAQEQPAVRQLTAAFLNDLLSLGVSGFRIDAAKHMVDADIQAIFSLLTYPFCATQEVIYGAGEPIQPSQYTSTGSVIEFRASAAAQASFSGGSGIASLVTPTPMGSAWGFIDSSIANYIMANHDTERGGSSLNYQSPNNMYLLSGVFMLGFNYGTPTVYSGYNFSSFDIGAPQNNAGFTNTVTCSSNGWRCEHRWPALANMVAFHNAAGSAALTNVQKGNNQQIAFGRGAAGFLVINNDGGAWTKTWATSLPAGTYCDIIHDNSVDPTICNGPSYVVSASGTFTASVGARDALALFLASSSIPPNTSSSTSDSSTTATSSTTNAVPTPVGTAVSITFVESASTGTGDVIKVVGSIAQLGSWAPSAALALVQSNGSWRLTLMLPPGTSLEYKFLLFTSSGSYTWEAGSNRVYSTGQAGESVSLFGVFGSTTSGTSAVTTIITSTSVVVSSSATSGASSSASSVIPSSSTESSASSSAPTSPSASSSTAPTSSTSTTSVTAPASTAVSITFVETATTGSGDVIKVVGSVAQLGSWNPAAALALSQPSLNADWRLVLTLPPGTSFEYKFIRVSSGGTVTWESGSNRAYTSPSGGTSVALYGIFGSTTSSSSVEAAAPTGSSVAPSPSPSTTASAPPVSTAVTITFQESATTVSGEVIKLVGSISQLGSWSPGSAITLSNNSNSVWSATLILPPNTSFQYKCTCLSVLLFVSVANSSILHSHPSQTGDC